MGKLRSAAAVAVLGTVIATFLVEPGGAANVVTTDTSNARNVFLDGTTANDRNLPSTASASAAGARIASLNLAAGNHVIFAQIVIGSTLSDFGGLVTCLLTPPNGPVSKAEYQFFGTQTPNVDHPGGIGLTTNTLYATTTNRGPGVVKFACTDGDPASTVKYRFLQLTAIEVPTLASRDLDP